MKKICILLVFALLMSCTAFAEGSEQDEISETDRQALAWLGSELQEPAGQLMRYGEDVDDIYSELSWQSMPATSSRSRRTACFSMSRS